MSFAAFAETQEYKNMMRKQCTLQTMSNGGSQDVKVFRSFTDQVVGIPIGFGTGPLNHSQSKLHMFFLRFAKNITGHIHGRIW